jgi:hypothetical protein
VLITWLHLYSLGQSRGGLRQFRSGEYLKLFHLLLLLTSLGERLPRAGALRSVSIQVNNASFISHTRSSAPLAYLGLPWFQIPKAHPYPVTRGSYTSRQVTSKRCSFSQASSITCIPGTVSIWWPLIALFLVKLSHPWRLFSWHFKKSQAGSTGYMTRLLSRFAINEVDDLEKNGDFSLSSTLPLLIYFSNRWRQHVSLCILQIFRPATILEQWTRKLHRKDMDFDSFVDEFDRARVGNNAPEGKSVRPTRKKFAIPPVKVACLEW